MDRLRRITAGLAFGLTAGCAAHLASPYDADIAAAAGSLEKDYLSFVAEREAIAGEPGDTYEAHAGNYARFDTDLAVISLRAARDRGGVSCGKALEIARSLGAPPDLTGLPAGSGDGTDAGGSCIRLEIDAAQRALADLQRADRRQCGRTAPPGRCANVFPPGTLDAILPGPLNRAQAPEASAALIAIDDLVGFERDIEPPEGSGK